METKRGYYEFAEKDFEYLKQDYENHRINNIFTKG